MLRHPLASCLGARPVRRSSGTGVYACRSPGGAYELGMAHTNEHATSQGFDRKWTLFFIATMVLVIGAFLAQRFVFAPAGVQTQGDHQGSEQPQSQPH